MNLKTRRVLALGLAAASSVGTIMTAVSAGKTAAKISRNVENNPQPESTKDYIKNHWKEYVGTFIIGGITVSSIIGNAILSRKTEASLMATAGAIGAGWKKYEDKVKEILGIEAHNDVVHGLIEDDVCKNKPVIENGKRLYFTEFTGLFIANPNDVMIALNTINQRILASDNPFDTNMYIKDFLDICKAEVVDDELGYYERYRTLGWNLEYLTDVYDTAYVTFELEEGKTYDKDQYTTIKFHQEPVNIDIVGE